MLVAQYVESGNFHIILAMTKEIVDTWQYLCYHNIDIALFIIVNVILIVFFFETVKNKFIIFQSLHEHNKCSKQTKPNSLPTKQPTSKSLANNFRKLI